MKTVTTKAIAKVAAVATGLAMATSMLSFASVANAASLTSAQVQSILSLLSSFGANSATIANVNSALTGTAQTTTSGSTTTTTTSSCSFTKDLTIGSTGADVTCLQNALKANGYMSANATGYFGALTQAGVTAWQKAAGVSPTAGYFGAKSRAAFNLGGSSSSTTTTTTTTGPSAGTGNGLKVMLSATSPNGTVLVQGQGIGDLADFVFANPTASPINVTALSFKRTGVSNDSTMTNVYLYNAGTRLTDSAGVSASSFTFSDPVALFTVPAGQTYTVSVRSDIAGSTSGQQIGVQLVSATSNGTLDSSVSFPINSGYQTISAANLASVSFGGTTSPTGASLSMSPQTSYPVWQNTITVSTNPVKLSSVRFTNLGSIDSQYIGNFRLYVDGVQVGSSVAAMTNRTVTFDLSAAPTSLTTSGHVLKLLADITGGASRTFQFSVQRSSDAMFVDNQLSQPVTPTNNGATFTAISASAVTINAVSSTGGVSVSVDPTSPNQAIAVGASSVNWANFDLLASGENTKVTDLYVQADTSIHNGGLANGKIMVNGVQVGSTKAIGEIGAQTDFGLGSSLILPAGQTTMVSIYADAKTSTSTNLSNNETVQVSLYGTSSIANAQGMSSLNSANVPAATVPANSITVSQSTLSASKYTGYGNQTVVPGSNNAKLGAFVLSAGSTEGVTVNTIGITLSTANAASITNLTLKDDMTGAVLGSVITTPAGSSNQFSVNVTLPLSSSKTFDIYGNVLTGANVGTIVASVDTNTAGVGSVTGQSTTANSMNLQTITVGAGTLTVTRGAGDPTSNNVLAGASSILVGEFNFAAQNTMYTVQNLAVVVPNNAATAVTSVTLSYKDVNGATQTQTQGLAVNTAMPYATATFTGLTMYVPANDSSNVDVYVGTPTIASGGTTNISGAGINVSLDTGNASTAIDNTFRAVNSAGAPSTVATAASTYMASNGTFYVRKSIPTFAMVNTGNSVPSTGTVLYKFTIAADPAGAVEWTQLVFNVSTSSSSGATTLSSVYLTDDSTGVSLITTPVSVLGVTGSQIATIDLIDGNGVASTSQQIGAGQTKTYDLYGTVSGYTTGSTITISLASATGSSPAANSSAFALNLANHKVVWSDRSASSHSVLTSDWTNGYLLKNFTSNAVSYSK